MPVRIACAQTLVLPSRIVVSANRISVICPSPLSPRRVAMPPGEGAASGAPGSRQAAKNRRLVRAGSGSGQPQVLLGQREHEPDGAGRRLAVERKTGAQPIVDRAGTSSALNSNSLAMTGPMMSFWSTITFMPSSVASIAALSVSGWLWIAACDAASPVNGISISPRLRQHVIPIAHERQGFGVVDQCGRRHPTDHRGHPTAAHVEHLVVARVQPPAPAIRPSWN